MGVQGYRSNESLTGSHFSSFASGATTVVAKVLSLTSHTRKATEPGGAAETFLECDVEVLNLGPVAEAP